MWNRKLCISLEEHYGLPVTEQIPLFSQAGFDGFFACWKPGVSLTEWLKTASDCGMFCQSVHAPFVGTDSLWREGEAGDRFAAMLANCLRDCADHQIPIVVMHAFIGFEDHTPTSVGIDRFGGLVRCAENLGVRIALENTEGEEYLAALMKAFAGSGAVGFCWDTGHEMCYNHSKDMAALYGDRLIATHLNDNLGIRDFTGRITWLDDLHLLPFDGIADWQRIAGRLKTFEGPLTFELNRCSKPGRHDNERYAAMPLQQYAALAYARACRVAVMAGAGAYRD